MKKVIGIAMILIPILDFIICIILYRLKYPFIIDKETLKDDKALRILQKFLYRELRLNIYSFVLRFLLIIVFVLLSVYYSDLVFVCFLINIVCLYLLLYSLEKIINMIKMIKCYNYTNFEYKNKNKILNDYRK